MSKSVLLQLRLKSSSELPELKTFWVKTVEESTELTLLVQKRFKYAPGTIVLYAERVQDRGLSAVAQAESMKFKLLNGLAIRRAAYGVVRYVMESGAKGCEVVVSGKLRAARAKAMKFADGFLIHSGQPVNDFIDVATRHVLMRQGVLGIKVKIMRDPAKNRTGPKALPDAVTIIEPKEKNKSLPHPSRTTDQLKKLKPQAEPVEA